MKTDKASAEAPDCSMKSSYLRREVIENEPLDDSSVRLENTADARL